MGFGGFGKGRLHQAALAAMATGSLIAMTAVVKAQSSVTDVASRSKTTVSVPAGPLEKGLLLLGRQTGIRLLYASTLTSGRTTQGLSGEMDATQAVAALLAGTGLQSLFTSENTVRIFDPAALQANGQAIQLDTITVDGQTAPGVGRPSVTGPVDGFVATETATGTKTSTPIIEIPQSISVVPQAQITAQGAQSVQEALRYTSGVFVENIGAGDFKSAPRVRGFIADLYLDGTRVPNPPSGAAYPEIEPYNLERIEVLKGPSSGLYGSSGPGGLVNATSKRPLDTPKREIELQTGSFNRKQVAFDFSDRFNGDNPNALFRLVGLFRDADSQIQFQEDNRRFIAPSITLKNDNTKLTLLASYFQSDGVGSFHNYMPASGTVLPNPNGRIAFDRYSGEPSYDDRRREQWTVGYALEHKINDSLDLRQNFRYMSVTFDHKTIAPNRVGSGTTANNPRTGLLVNDPTMQTVGRTPIYIGSDNNALTLDNQIEGRFVTGPLTHTVVAGFDYRKVDANYTYLLGIPLPPFNLFNPNYGAAITPPSIPLQSEEYELKQVGLYAQDQIKFGDGWIVTLSGRKDWASVETLNNLNLAQGWYGPDDKVFTGRAGLGYEFKNGLVPYVSYATSFDPTIGTDSAGNAFMPTTGEQYEAGVKFQPVGTKILITAALFDITQQNVLTRDPVNTNFNIQTGEVSSKGFEFEARGEVLHRLNIIAAYTYLNAEITKSNIPGEVGHRLNFAPEHQASFWAQYGLSGPLEGLTVGAGVRYVGSQEAFIPGATYGTPVGVVAPYVLNTPSYTLVDAMLSYDLVNLHRSWAGAKLQVNATNLFDTWYVAGCATVIQCGLGNGRRVLATLSYRW